MANQVQNIAPVSNNLSDITDLVSLFKSMPTNTTAAGTKTTGPSAQVTSSNITPEGTQAMVQAILGGTSGVPGLAAVSSGQKSAGLYNSTTNQQLTNDLTARVAGQAAQLSAGTTVTNTGSTTTDNTTQQVAKAPPLSASTIANGALALGVNALGQKAYKSISDIIGGDNSASAVSSAVFPSGDLTGYVGTQANTSLGSGLSSLNSDPALISNLGTGLGEAGSGSIVDAALGSGTSDTVPEALSGVSDYGGVAGTGIANAALGEGSVGLATAAGVDAAGISTVAGLGSTAGAAGAGLLEGTAAGAESAGIGEVLAAILWVVCTELNTQGRLPNKYYYYGAIKFSHYSSAVKTGYYTWAVPSTKHLRKYPYSLYSRFLCTVFNARAEWIASQSNVKGARCNLLGLATELVLYPICWTLGTLGIKKQNPMSLYVGGK